MPRITTKRIKRIHLSLFEQEYLELSELAAESNTSVSELIRIMIYHTLRKKKEIQHNFEQIKSNGLNLNV